MPTLLSLLRAQYPGESDEKKESRIPAKKAGYMSLQGAKADGDCEIVYVKGGVSGDLGCCNLFRPKDKSVDQFRCGTCRFYR